MSHESKFNIDTNSSFNENKTLQDLIKNDLSIHKKYNLTQKEEKKLLEEMKYLTLEDFWRLKQLVIYYKKKSDENDIIVQKPLLTRHIPNVYKDNNNLCSEFHAYCDSDNED